MSGSYLNPAVNPYDPKSHDPETQTRPLDQLLREAFRTQALQLRVCLPAVIVDVLANQTVTVQPTLQYRKIQNSEGTNMPQIQHVPVSMPMGADYSVKLPMASGDTGMLIFSDRSLDAWLAGGGEIVDPQDSRIHDFADAIFVPGLVPFANQTQDQTTDLVVTNGQAVARFQKAGTFEFKNDQFEMVSLLSQITGQAQELAQTLSTDTVNTVFGPMKLNAFATYATIANTLQSLLNALNTLKGS